jgi:hypothetical protein
MACDWVIMRSEEMLLIEAEAKGRLNLAEGKSLLESFVKTYRDPAYTSTATSIDGFINEVWFQRRVELWGEGHGPFDLMRLKKPLVRFNSRVPNSNVPELYRFNLAADDGVMLLRIPMSEITANLGINPEDNNQGGTLFPVTPNTGAGLLDGVTD